MPACLVDEHQPAASPCLELLPAPCLQLPASHHDPIPTAMTPFCLPAARRRSATCPGGGRGVVRRHADAGAASVYSMQQQDHLAAAYSTTGSTRRQQQEGRRALEACLHMRLVLGVWVVVRPLGELLGDHVLVQRDGASQHLRTRAQAMEA